MDMRASPVCGPHQPLQALPGLYIPSEKILLKLYHFILIHHKGQVHTRTIFLLEMQRDNWIACECLLPYFALTLEKT